jgi:hypothetical protein
MVDDLPIDVADDFVLILQYEALLAPKPPEAGGGGYAVRG